MKILIVITGLFWGLTSLAAAPSEFHYWVRVPQSTLSCGDEAVALGARFAQATSKKVTQAKCVGVNNLPAEGKTYPLYSIDLTYLSNDWSLVPTSAVFGEGDHSVIPHDSVGAYATYESCREDLAAQSALFEAQTGLKTVSARCEPSRDSYSHSYVLTIDGFGKPAAWLRSFEFDFEGEADSEFRDQGTRLLIQHGAVFARTWGNQVLYYAKNDVPVRHRNLYVFKEASECLSQLNDAQSIFIHSGAPSVFTRCLAVTHGVYNGYLSLEVIDDSGRTISTSMGATSPRYYSFTECMTDRQRLVDAAVARGIFALGGLCYQDPFSDRGEFVFDLYSVL
ncbi:hypothetical protein WDW37_20635 [Bdellovibrionota bacterium FG-1]